MTFMDTGHPSMFNRYAYTFNDPVNMIDPDGLSPCSSMGDCEDNPPVEEPKSEEEDIDEIFVTAQKIDRTSNSPQINLTSFDEDIYIITNFPPPGVAGNVCGRAAWECFGVVERELDADLLNADKYKAAVCRGSGRLCVQKAKEVFSTGGRQTQTFPYDSGTVTMYSVGPAYEERYTPGPAAAANDRR